LCWNIYRNIYQASPAAPTVITAKLVSCFVDVGEGFTFGLSDLFEISGLSFRYQVSGMATTNKRPAINLNNSITSTPQKPNAKQSKLEEEKVSDLSKIYDLIACMNKKLDKLDAIEQRLSRVDEDIRELKKSCEYAHESTEELEGQVKQHDKMIKDMKEWMEKLKEDNKKLSDTAVDLRARSMRNNLVIYNLDENDKEEDVNELVRDVIEKLGIESDEIEIDRAHRMGKKRGGKPRPVVARFLRYQDRERIRKAAYNLKGSKIGISEQFPKEIADRRKLLYPVFKKAKAEGNTAKLVRDQLYINGQRYIGSST